MDKILLTDEEAEDIVHGEHDVCSRCEGEGRLWADGLAHYYDPNRPTKACPNCDGTGRVWSGREYEALCRAQVRKVVEWLKKNNVAGQCYDSDLVDKWDLMLASEVWEELQLLVFHITEREETRQRMAALREAAGEGKDA